MPKRRTTDLKPDAEALAAAEPAAPADPEPAAPAKRQKTTYGGDSKGAWTPAELLQLYAHVTTHGKTRWEAAVPGRSAQQARETWGRRLDGILIKTIAGLGGKA